MNRYTDILFAAREAYLEDLADEYCVPLEVVRAMAVVLGEDEDFDGLVSAVEDFSDTLYFDEE